MILSADASRLPAFDALRLGINAEAEEAGNEADERREGTDKRSADRDEDENHAVINEVAGRTARSKVRRR